MLEKEFEFGSFIDPLSFLGISVLVRMIVEIKRSKLGNHLHIERLEILKTNV